MTVLRIIATSAVLAFVHIAPAPAQGGAPPPEAREQTTNPPNAAGTVHPQHETGTTGWSGGNRAAGTTSTKGDRLGSDPAASQPEMATGLDLNGPPKRFRPSETPE